MSGDVDGTKGNNGRADGQKYDNYEEGQDDSAYFTAKRQLEALPVDILWGRHRRLPHQ